MTRNQIAFWNLQELKRSNVASLEEQRRHNVEGEQIARANYTESVRHNQMSEQQAADNLAELARSNRTSESIRSEQNAVAYQQALEIARHNRNYEILQASQVTESVRHNVAQEQELQRSNLVQESLSTERNRLTDVQNKIREVESRRTAFNNEMRNLHDSFNLIETSRSNKANENIKRESSVMSLLGNLGKGIASLFHFK